jgi:membrane-associated phospholipid phosphatase
MRLRGAVACSLLSALWAAAPGVAAADDVVQPWQRLGANLAEIYGWPNLTFHLGAAAVTPPLVLAADEAVQVYFQRHDPLGEASGVVALTVGGGLPIALPAALYLGGLAADDSELASAGAAAVQAMVVQVVAVHALKWLTDRPGPYPDGDPKETRWSEGLLRDSLRANDFNFNPFDLKGGLRWPSGHTASNVALVSVLFGFYPDQLWIALFGYPYALAIGVGMIEGDYHWLSDIVAGALIGHVVGWVIGQNMRAEYEARKAARARTAGARRSSSEPSLRLGVMTGAAGLSATLTL